jgi:hypothetical protein
MTTMGCMVDHIHLDKNTFSILFQKGKYAVLYYLFFFIVTMYIYMEINEFNFTSSNGLILSFLK